MLICVTWDHTHKATFSMRMPLTNREATLLAKAILVQEYTIPSDTTGQSETSSFFQKVSGS